MDATTTPVVRSLPAIADDPRSQAKSTEHLIDALKEAIEAPGDHRLFRWGKLAGLFLSRVGDSGHAATTAVRDGLLEITRTETRGKLIVEWVRATPAALAFLHDHDSPKAVLRELRGVLGATKSAIPHWMEQARDEASLLALRFEHRAQEMLERLTKLSERVESALRRAEAAKPALGSAMANLVPWGIAALEYLDRRADTLPGDCPLPDLFRALVVRFPDLTITAYQDGLRRLHDACAIRLLPSDAMDEPEFAFVIDKQPVWLIRR
jgi:hypothetical protein